MQEGEWRLLLRDARRQLRLTQPELAERAGISVNVIRAYEAGRRHPPRPQLDRILSSLQVDRGWRNRVLVAAGYAPDGLDQRPSNIEEWYLSCEEAAAEIESYPWPSFVSTELAEVAAANSAMQALWNMDLSPAVTDPLARSLLCIAIDPRVAEHVVNWDEAMRTVIRTFKSFHRGPETLDDPSPYFGAVLERFSHGDVRYVGRLWELWRESSDTFPPRIRWAYPITWREDDGSEIRFKCIVSAGNESDGLSLNDWIPVDDLSWTVLRHVLDRRAPR
jgi:transcriptional regulator with XRE-family HTH domain